jgi:hypothetical protein
MGSLPKVVLGGGGDRRRERDGGMVASNIGTGMRELQGSAGSTK